MTVVAWDGTSEYSKESYRAIRIDGDRFLSTTPITVAYLAAAAGRDSTYQFFQERDGDRPDTLLMPTDVIELQDGNAFYAIPPYVIGSGEESDRVRRITQRALDGIVALVRQLDDQRPWQAGPMSEDREALRENIAGVAAIIGELGDCKTARPVDCICPKPFTDTHGHGGFGSSSDCPVHRDEYGVVQSPSDAPAENELEAIAALLVSAVAHTADWRERAQWLFERGVRIQVVGAALPAEHATPEPGRVRNVIAGLEIFQRQGSKSVNAEHDVVYAGPSSKDALNETDRDTLRVAGWFWDEEVESWAIFV